MVTTHGHVKLLDFGLAQPDVAATPGAETRTSSARASSYSGTPHYMAPEAASGDPVTARADLFSLGAILFEALSGKLPFAGATPYDYVRHLLTSDPRPLYRLAPHAPADLVSLIERCLEKVPAQRPESAGEIVSALARLAESLTGTGVKLPTAAQAHARQRRRRWAIGALAAALVAAAAGAAWWLIRPTPVELVRRARPFVDWAGDERDSRVSPDGKWVSFISNRGGSTQLYLQSIDGAEAKAVTLMSGRPISHVWSADGRELACVIAEGGRMRIEIVPAFFGGRARSTVAIDPAPARVRLSRWVGGALFFQADTPDAALLRADLETLAVTNLSASWKIDGLLMSLDVAPDGARAAFIVRRGGQEDLWTARLDGSSARALTNDAFFERRPLWSGDGSRIFVQSNRGGQIDLWDIDPVSGHATALTSSATVEIPESTSADGRVVSYQQESEDSRLWAWDPSSGTGRQLSAAGLNEATPDASRDGGIVAVQRRKPTDLEATLVDATIVAGPFEPAGTFDPRAIGDGFAARVSPDGRRVAFLQRPGMSGPSMLVVQDIDTSRRSVISRHAETPVNSPFPASWVEHNVDWAPDGRSVYFVDHDGTFAIRRADLDAAPGSASGPLVRVPDGGFPRDVYVSPDGRLLAFLTWADRTFQVQLLDIGAGRTRVLTTTTGRTTGVFGRGWLASGREMVLVRALDLNEDLTASVEVMVVSVDGAARRAALIDRAFVGTARLDPAGTLSITRSEQGIHNVYRCVIATGALTRLTDNRFQGLTFSALVPAQGGVLVGVRHEIKRDIWLSEAAPDPNARKEP
jgi:serine/threonine-protein kinase